MKNKFKSYLKLGILLFCISFLLTNCEKDLNEEVPAPQSLKSKLKIETLNSKQVNSNSKVAKKLQNLFTKSKESVNSGSAREIYNEEYGFTVNTDIVKYIQDFENNSHSYTFQIIRENNDINTLENLVLSSVNQTEYTAQLIRYHLTNEQLHEIYENNHVSTYYSAEIEQLNGDFSQYLRISNCTTSMETYHIPPNSNDQWPWNENTTCYHAEPGDDPCTLLIVLSQSCTSGGASTGPGTTGTPTDSSGITTGNPGSSTTNTGTTSSSNTNTTSGNDTTDGFDENGEVIINTTPVIVLGLVQTPQEYVQEILNTIKTKAEQAWSASQLTINSLDYPTEHGFIIYKENGVIKTSDLYTSGLQFEIKWPDIKNTINQLPAGVEVIGYFHTHPTPVENINGYMALEAAPSHIDMASLLSDTVLKQISYAGQMEIIYTESKTYVVHVTNQTQANNWLQNNNLKTKRKIKKKYLEIFNNLQGDPTYMNTVDALQQSVLEVIGNNQNGILFYETTTSNNVQLVN